MGTKLNLFLFYLRKVFMCQRHGHGHFVFLTRRKLWRSLRDALLPKCPRLHFLRHSSKFIFATFWCRFMHHYIHSWVQQCPVLFQFYVCFKTVQKMSIKGVAGYQPPGLIESTTIWSSQKKLDLLMSWLQAKRYFAFAQHRLFENFPFIFAKVWDKIVTWVFLAVMLLKIYVFWALSSSWHKFRLPALASNSCKKFINLRYSQCVQPA